MVGVVVLGVGLRVGCGRGRERGGGGHGGGVWKGRGKIWRRWLWWTLLVFGGYGDVNFLDW